MVPDKNDYPQFVDEHRVVHYVGHHKTHARGRDVFTECDAFIGTILNKDGFYGGNICSFVTCIGCLARSNFGTYAPR